MIVDRLMCAADSVRGEFAGRIAKLALNVMSWTGIGVPDGLGPPGLV
jgi:hypothetical protein